MVSIVVQKVPMAMEVVLILKLRNVALTVWSADQIKFVATDFAETETAFKDLFVSTTEIIIPLIQ